MLQVLPFLTWLAAITSGVLLASLWYLDELRRHDGAALLGWFLLAGYLQFLGRSPLVAAIGLLSQTVLAIVLTVRLKLAH